MNNSMTKEEAERKWCPMTFNGGDIDHCCHIACAVWQWDYKNNSVGPLPEEEWRGHCGLIKQ